MWVVALMAQSASAATVEGRITGAAGQGVSGANVVAYDSRFRFFNVLSEADGAYRIDDVPSGVYRVRVLPPSETTVQERWEGDTLVACEAPPHVLDDDDVLTIDVALPPARELRGQLVLRDRTPLGGARVELKPTWYREFGASARSAETGLDGRFSITGVPSFRSLPDTHLLEVGQGAVPEQYFRGAFEEDDATPIEIDADVTDVGPISLWFGTALSGRVTGPDGPIDGAEVRAFAGRLTVVTVTDADGAWSIEGLQPGPVVLWATAEGMARTYHPEGGIPPEPAVVFDGEDAAYLDVDIEMRPQSVVTGTLVTSGDPTLANVLLVDETDAVAIATEVGEDGRFSVEGLPAARWRVEVYGPELGFIEGPLYETHDSAEPVYVEVAEGETLDIGRIEPLEGARLEGVVLDSVSGAPVYGGVIIAERQEDGARRLAFTGRNGAYELVGVQPGSWTLQVAYSPFCAEDPGWVSVYWPQQVNPDIGGSVGLRPGETFTWDPLMPPDADTDRMGDDWEALHGLDLTVDDSELDPDGDGFSNLLEYRLGTDPNEVFDRGGCSCAGTRVGLVLPLWLVGLGLARRRRRSATFDVRSSRCVVSPCSRSSRHR
jgi:hypothetical protein